MNPSEKKLQKLLHHADDQAIEKIAEICPAVDQADHDRLLTEGLKRLGMSEFSAQQEIVHEEMIFISRFRHTWTMAACLLFCIGTIGGSIWMIRHLPTKPDTHQTAEELASEPETESESRAESETVFVIQTATQPVTESTAVIQTMTESETTAPETEKVQEEIIQTTMTETESISETQVSETLLTTVITEETESQKTEIIQNTEPETELFSESELESETETVPEESITDFVKLEPDENGLIHLPDFSFKGNQRDGYTIDCEKIPNPKHQIEMHYIPSYFPETFARYNQINEIYRSAVQNAELQKMCYQNEKYYINNWFSFVLITDLDYNVIVSQYSIMTDVFDQTTDALLESIYSDIKVSCDPEEIYAYPIGEKIACVTGEVVPNWACYTISNQQKILGMVNYSICWENDGYLFRLENLIPMDESGDFIASLEKSEDFWESIKMAESLIPFDTTGKSVEDYPVYDN